MKSDVAKRIESINNGIIPEGYKKTKVGIVPVEWEEMKLEEISDYITKGATPTTYGFNWLEEGIPFFRNDSIKNNTFIYGDFSYISEDANKMLNRSEVKMNDIVIAITGDIGKVGMIPDGIEKANINQHLARIRIIKKSLPYFVYQFLSSDEIQKMYKVIKTGISMPQLSLEQIRDTVIILPSLPEQQKIAEILSTQDKLIELQERKINQLKTLKKGYLQKMFPKKGCKYPELRFKGFTDAWEQRKVSDLFKITRGYVLAATLTGPQKTDNTPYPVYSSQTKDKGLMGYYKDFLYEDAITWTTDGANAGTVSYRAGKFYCTNVCGVLLSDNVTANQMIAEALNNVAKGYVSYVGNPKLMNNVMADIEIYIPPKAEERERISEYFLALDNLITLHQRKLDEEKQKKKALMQLLLTGKVRVKL